MLVLQDGFACLVSAVGDNGDDRRGGECVSIDDPISAAEWILANEELERSLVQRYAGQIAACLPGSVAKALSKLLREEEADKLAFMVGVLAAELRRVSAQVEELMNASEAHRAFAHEDWPALLKDGLRRAEQTRAKDRIARIAIILSNALVEEAVPAADDVEEMMRVAMDLADRDVLALKLIADSASGSYWKDRLSLQHAWDLFKRVPFRHTDSRIRT